MSINRDADKITLEPIQLGMAKSQQWDEVPYTFDNFTFQPPTLIEPGTNVAINSFTGRLNVVVPCNYIVVNPSLRGNAVYVRIGSGDMPFVLLNGIYYPQGHVFNNGSLAPFEKVIPAKKNWSFAFTIFAPGLTVGYQDAMIIGYGFNPSYLSRTVGEVYGK